MNSKMQQPNRFISGSNLVSDQALLDAEDAMIAAGEWPKTKPLPVREFSNDAGTNYRLWYDKRISQWVLDYTYADGTSGQTISDLRSDLLIQFSTEQLQHQAAQSRIEAENAPVVMTEAQQEQAEWQDSYHSGKVFLEIRQYCTQETVDHVSHMILGKLGSMHLPLTAPNLDAAFRYLWDNADGKLANIIDQARAEKSRLDLEAQTAAELAAAEARKSAIVEAPTPSANVRLNKSTGRIIRDEPVDKDDLTMDIKSLRHKALFQRNK